MDYQPHESYEKSDTRAQWELCFHAMHPDHDAPGGRLWRYGLNRQLFRLYSDKRTAPVPRLTKSFFPDDSQPVIVAVLPYSVLLAPCLHALTALLPLMNQLSPLVHLCDSLCFRYRHVLLYIVFQVHLFFWTPVFQVLWIVSHDWWGLSRRGMIEPRKSILSKHPKNHFESSKQSNISLDRGRLEAVLDLYCLIIPRANLRSRFMFS